MRRRQFLTWAGLLAGSAAVLPGAVLAAPIRDGASETVVAAYKNTTADILARIQTRLLETRA